MFGLVAVELEVPELGVGHQRAVVEQARPDPRSEREHDDDAVAAATGAVAHLGQPGSVGIVDHVHRTARGGGEHGVDVRADPRLVDVRRATGDSLAHHRWKGHADVAFPLEVVDELAHHRGHRLRSRRPGREDLVTLGGQRPGREVDGGRLHPRTADVDAERHLRVRAHARTLGGLVHSPSERPMISFMISVVPP